MEDEYKDNYEEEKHKMIEKSIADPEHLVDYLIQFYTNQGVF